MKSVENIALPEGFDDFAPYADWALPSESERREKHFSQSTFEELTALHSFGHEITESGKTRIENALAYLDQFPLDDMPQDAKHLLWILHSIAGITSTIEAWGEINPSHIGDYRRFMPLPDTEYK